MRDPAFAKPSSRITHYGLRITDYALRITDYGLRITHHGLRITDASSARKESGKMKVRGMRDVPGPQSVANRKQANTREQAVTDLTRLEHEKARLERELSVWTTKAEATSHRLEQIRGQLEALQNSLYGAETASPPASRARSNGSSLSRSANDTEAPEQEKTWREIPMEY
jgi:hypothetical protein